MAAPNEPNTAKARQARKRKRQKAARDAGTLAKVRGKVWAAMERIEEVLDSDDDALVIRASHALFQGAASYVRLVEVGELEARIEELEKGMEARAGSPSGSAFQRPHATA